MENNKKILIPTIVAVVTLIVLVVGATYAYFTVGATNNFETRTIEASADSVGVVTLTSSEDNLYLNLPAHLMMKDAIPEGEDDVIYYATTDPDGLPTTEATKYTAATFTLTGEGTYECSVDYDLDISGTMFEKAQELVDDYIAHIVISGYGYEFTHWLVSYSSGDEVYDDDECATNGKCTSNFKFKIGDSYGNEQKVSWISGIVNSSAIDQSVYAGTSMTAELDITNFSCTAIS